MSQHYALGFWILIGGCQAMIWKPMSPHISQQVQANDGSQVAIIMQSDEENLTAQKDPSHMLASSRNFKHQIFVQDELGSFYYLKQKSRIFLNRCSVMIE